MLRVGVLGAGHLGKIHLRLLKQSEKYELVGFYDAFDENANKVAAEFGDAQVIPEYLRQIEAILQAKTKFHS